MRKKNKLKLFKSAQRLPLASMLPNWMPSVKKSGKHHSQEMIAIKKRQRNRIKRAKKKGVTL